MGEIAVAAAGEELTALGLGSCIGLAIVDWPARIGGLAHVVLPQSGGRTDEPGKFADTAVPRLLRMLDRAGASPRRLEAVIAGGAKMFETTAGLDIGSRNEQAVRSALAAERITVTAARTGGSQGRTVTISLAEGVVTVRVAGEQSETLLEAPSASAPDGSLLGASALRLGMNAATIAGSRGAAGSVAFGGHGPLAAVPIGGGGRL